jgi:site-specific recombinase XerD
MPNAKTKLKVVAPASTELQGLVDDWLAGMRARGLSPRSLSQAKDTVERGFLRWAAARDVTTAQQLDQELLEELSRYLLEEHKTPQGKPLSRESVRTYLRTMKGFVRWAQKHGELGEMKVTLPKAPQRTLDVLSRAEIADMERAATSERDKLIVRLLGDTGVRLGELLALRPEDLIKNRDARGNARFLHINGKGNKERLVAIDPRLFDRLERYSKRPQAREATTARIFTTDRRSRHGGYDPLAQRTVQQMVRYLAMAAHIDKPERVHPHLFRHSAITWMVNNNVPVEHIRQQVGHADLSLITAVYSHVTPSDRYESMLALIRRDEDDRRR